MQACALVGNGRDHEVSITVVIWLRSPLSLAVSNGGGTNFQAGYANITGLIF